MASTTDFDFSFVFENNTYTYDNFPAEDNYFVQEQKEKVLGTLKLKDLIEGLKQGAGLINLAHYGVVGFPKLVVQMSHLQSDYSSVCAKSERELKFFAEESEDIQGQMMDVIEQLQNRDFKGADDVLQKWGEKARGMSKRARSLAAEFTAVETLAFKILDDTEETKGAEEAKAAEIKSEVNKLKSNVDGVTAALNNLAESKAKLEKYYNEAKKKADQASSRAYDLEIVGAIFKPLAAGMGSFAGGPISMIGAAAKSGIPTLSKSNAVGQNDKAQTEQKQAQAEFDKATEAFNATDKIYTERNNALTEKKTALAAAEANLKAHTDTKPSETDSAAKAEYSKKLNELTAKVQMAQSQVDPAQTGLNDIQKDYDTKKDALSSAQKKLDTANAALKDAGSAGSGPTQMSGSYSDIAVAYNQEKEHYLDLLLEKERQELENKKQLAIYNSQIATFTDERNVIRVACSSLFLAIGALKTVKVVLDQAAQFWTSMADKCDRQDESEGLKKLGEIAKSEKPNNLSDRSKKNLYQYFAGWRAIQLVCQEYQKIAAEVKGQVDEDFKMNLTIDNARLKAEELAKVLLADSENQLAQSNETISQLNQERDAFREAQKQAEDAKKPQPDPTTPAK